MVDTSNYLETELFTFDVFNLRVQNRRQRLLRVSLKSAKTAAGNKDLR
jgi:hypothetical protein